MLERIKFDQFTAFDDLEIRFSPGINIFVGENGTGKTHILKAAYAACDIVQTHGSFAEKLTNVFHPSGKQIGRLVRRPPGGKTGSVLVARRITSAGEAKTLEVRLSFSNHTTKPDKATLSGSFKAWMEHPLESVYIPVKDMMAHAPGFRSLYEKREIHFEEIYVDIIRKASIPFLKGPMDAQRKHLLDTLQRNMNGKVLAKNEEFFLTNKDGVLEFTLLSEGYRKLGLLWMLIRNGTLSKGSILFWDEPETNLNPKLMQAVVHILIALQRIGVQIFLTTHDYVILKEFDLQIEKTDSILFHSLFRQNREIVCVGTENFADVSPNVIDDTFGELVSREIRKNMAGETP